MVLCKFSFSLSYSLTFRLGLRLLLNVNQSDYLPHIEGAGVRVVVHHQSQAPFPDTFGYSAPTGAISSFGLKYVGLFEGLVFEFFLSHLISFFFSEKFSTKRVSLEQMHGFSRLRQKKLLVR